MTNSGGGSKGFQQVNNCVKAESQGDVSGFVGIGPVSQGDNELRTSKVDENVQDGCDQVALQGNAAPQAPQQQPHWERFLHVRSIKVMLVENDDCTRHVVTALLRNCNYEVIEAADGFQAWKILENLSNHIDIVLTEVVMPCLSGIGLLCKIMSHRTRKNIPVIMMSSHDSMGLVFKCLSKGAVDFLVKPIRKNELKNLWQHVWRRCHSSSGSGSESGTQAQKSVNSESNLRYDNSCSKDGYDNESTGGGSDDGSGTQSSWIKQAADRESPEAASPSDQIAEHPGSTCGLNQGGQPYNVGKAKGIAMCRSNSEMQIDFPIEVPNKHSNIKQNARQDIKREHSSSNHKAKHSKIVDSDMENWKIESRIEPVKIMDANIKVIDGPNAVIVGELGLKRPRATKHDEKEVQDGCNVLKHSELSAFTRYKTTANAVKGKTGITASCPQPDKRSNIVKNEYKHDTHSDGYLMYKGSSEQVMLTEADMTHQELRIEHIHHHHHVHHYHNIDTENPLSNHDGFGLNKFAEDAPHCESSNIMGGPVEGNPENCSLNRSGSGSKHGSNVQDGSSAAVNFEVTNVESDVGLVGNNGSGDASGSGRRNIIDHKKSAQREAALTKFRQKREMRCFQKKVRYQNRKRLAEQRPRARGQFVKGTSRNSSSNAADGHG